ncbi:MAG TPA: condensation domain-containing protein, partial [Burkholderiaceae bacterium]|nr:condensation domain-containing protein [Burkholderiaceae bacterium]
MSQRDKTLPPSFAQQRLWFIAQLNPQASVTYNLARGFQLRGPLDESALRAALDRIVLRHEVLRTCLVPINGRPRQRILQDASFMLQVHDLSASADPIEHARHLAREEALQPFDFANGPLFRGRLLRLADQNHVLLLSLHHAISDGWSIAVLVNEITTLYAAFAAGLPDPLPPLPIQYADYAIWQRETLPGPAMRKQLDYWRQKLKDAAGLLSLPTDRPRPVAQSTEGASVAIDLPPGLCRQLEQLSRRHNCTLFMTLLAAWTALLARLSGQQDMVIGAAVSGRNRPELEALIGFFVNTLALRLDLSGAPSVADWLARVRETTLAAQDHQDVPFEQVVEAVNPSRSLAHQPLLQVMFSFESVTPGASVAHSPQHLQQLQVEPFDSAGHSQIDFDLTLALQRQGERITGTLGYATALFDRATIERHAALLQTLLQGMVADEQAAVARLPLLPAAEFDLLLSFNATEAPFPAGLCIHQLFEQQVRRTPEAPALVFEDTTLSYAQLDAQANALAAHLRALGLRPGQCLALGLPRSMDLVRAELAALKCGAAYVPLDPEHPPERLGFVLADCAATLLLCPREL